MRELGKLPIETYLLLPSAPVFTAGSGHSFLLAPTYPGYRHTRQVMSVLGNRSAPFHTVYTLWLLFLGTAILLTCAQLCPLLWGRSGGLSLALAAILIIYALGGCILSGLFPVSETKAMETLSAKIHGFGSVLGFLG